MDGIEICPACGLATLDLRTNKVAPMHSAYHRKKEYDGFLFWKRNVRIVEYLEYHCRWCGYTFKEILNITNPDQTLIPKIKVRSKVEK